MFDLVIIGAGPAGITAGIYAKRANLNVAVIEKGAPGGQMINTSEIENYPGFAKIGGADLALEMFNHGMSLGVQYIFDDVVELKDGKLKQIITKTNSYQAKAVIIATGASPRKLNLEHEEMLSSKGISWCAICDGPIYKGKDVVVVGGGNSAVEEASYLAAIVKSVTIIQNLKELTADKKAIEILLKKENVKIHYQSTVQEFLIDENNNLIGVKIKTGNAQFKTIKTDGVFEYIGLKPETAAFTGLRILNDYGYIPTDENMATKLAGIFAVGDVREKQIRQVVTATNDGAIAVQSVFKYLETWL
ncbi:MAG: FAD-dependent oxidoreductase [Acholeplasmataceae bacterium]|nr:FAD-dependent oxidoreductase [Acholeplasmataceae bacterium]